SLISGYNLANGESLPSVSLRKLREAGYDVEVINEGIAGDTTSGGKARLKWSLDRKRPDIVILALGGNDMLRGISTDVIRSNIEAMLFELQQRKIKTILVRVTAPPNYDAVYADALTTLFAEAGVKYNVPVYPFLLEPIFGNAGYMQQDGVHPNALGVEFIATYMNDYLMKTGWLKLLPGAAGSSAAAPVAVEVPAEAQAPAPAVTQMPPPE
ncbi:MAG: arylesterase, partial [Alphaproteobacteria bacterium]|nr:arylesterase [Alphaproteobacteria bacterium]